MTVILQVAAFLGPTNWEFVLASGVWEAGRNVCSDGFPDRQPVQ